MKDMERLKNALGIDSSIIEQQYYNEINKVQKLCGNLNSGRAMDDNDDMMCNLYLDLL
jgi:hypothetical protein